MPSSDDNEENNDIVRETYRPQQDRTLSEAVLDAIGAYKDTNVTKSEFVLYDAINPDAVDKLIRHDAQANPELKFDVGGVRVNLWGNSPVHIKVIDVPSQWE